MGSSQSHAEFFRAPTTNALESDDVDPLVLLYRVERTLWRVEPPWLKPPTADSQEGRSKDEKVASSDSTGPLVDIDPTAPMTAHQALELVPTLIDDNPLAWGCCLVLFSVVDEGIFVKVNGVARVMELLAVDSTSLRLLALEVIHTLCLRGGKALTQLNERGLTRNLTQLLESPDDQLAFATLKVLRLNLSHSAVRDMVGTCGLLPALMSKIHSSTPAIAKLAVMCVGFTLPNANNMAEIVRLGCIESLLKAIASANVHAHAHMRALSLIADENASIFPRELTLATVSKMLDTLRGGAKRSKNAAACAYLFASLCRSDIFRHDLCIESNLSILSKLLVGGSPDVLRAAAFALGIASYESSDRIKESLFKVEAPLNLLNLIESADLTLVRLIIFATGSILDESLVLRSGKEVNPDRAGRSESLRHKMQLLCEEIINGPGCDIVIRLAIESQGGATTFAVKNLSCMVLSTRIKRTVTRMECVREITLFVSNAADSFLEPLLLFFIECSSTNPDAQLNDIGEDVDFSVEFCRLLGQMDDTMNGFVTLFDAHKPERLVGLLTLFSNFASKSAILRSALTSGSVIERVLSMISKSGVALLHLQALSFLDNITGGKNQEAIKLIFMHSPDRLVNMLHSSMPTVQELTGNVLRRIFKRHNSPDLPASGARRHLVNLLSHDDKKLAVCACRVWGSLFIFEDKRESFALIINGAESILKLLYRCFVDFNPDEKNSSKDLLIVTRSLCRASLSEDVSKEIAIAPSFLTLVNFLAHPLEKAMEDVVQVFSAIGRSRELRKYVAVPPILTAVEALLRDRKENLGPVYRVAWLRFIGIIGRRDGHIQRLLVELKVVEAIVILTHSPTAALSADVQRECIETLAWLCTDDVKVRKMIATPKLVDICLKCLDSLREILIVSCLHLLQRMSVEEEIKSVVKTSGGATVIMRIVFSNWGVDTKYRACSLVRNLVTDNDKNKVDFQRLGFNPAVVTLISNQEAPMKLLVRGTQALGAMCQGTTPDAKSSKREILECQHSSAFLGLATSKEEEKLRLAWCETLINVVHASPSNQKKLADANLTGLVVQFLSGKDTRLLQISAARLLALMASLPENRCTIMEQGEDAMLAALIAGLQSDSHELQRYVALCVANLSTRSSENKIKIGAAGTVSPLIDRLSSKQLNVIENVLHAVMKLGSHAGNKVKFGTKVCFEKLLSLLHHDELVIRKTSVSTIAVLIEGNDANKKFLLQCDASVVTELCALMKSTNGKVVESAMLILGELSQLPEQTLEISKYIDIVVIVRMIEHHNARIRRAALHTVLNLTKESFNKLRFGIQECVDALLGCLQSEDMLIVELAATCLANLSFTASNAARIASSNSLGILLRLAAASTSSKDYLSWKEARFLRLERGKHDDGSRSPQRKSPLKAAVTCDSIGSMSDDFGAEDNGEPQFEEEFDDKLEPFIYSSKDTEEDGEQQVLDFSSFPGRQTSVLEHTLLVISNCAGEFHSKGLVEKVAVKVVCQALGHPSELAKRCSCFILGFWCKKDSRNQELATNQSILPVLIQLLNSPNINVVEAALYALAKLAYFADNHLKLLQLELVTTLIQTILRKPSNLSREGLMDRTIRLLGTLVSFPKVRQTIKSEEVVSDILTGLLQTHRVVAKNISRLLLSLLEEESLKFFMPKKTVMILRAIFTDDSTEAKTTRNILKIFDRIAIVEEHKITIALEDSGEALGRMIEELFPVVDKSQAGVLPVGPPNAATVLSILACISSTRRIALILHEKEVYAVLPLYLLVAPPPEDVDKETFPSEDKIPILKARKLEQEFIWSDDQMLLDAVVIGHNMCKSLGDKAGSRLSQLDFTHHLVIILRALAVDDVLSRQSHECFCILDLLSFYPKDEAVLLAEYAVDVILAYFKLWVLATELDGTIEGRAGESMKIDLVQYGKPMIQVLHNMARHEENNLALVGCGGIPTILHGLEVAILTKELKLLLVHAFNLLCVAHTAIEWFDTQDIVSPLFRFMYIHRADPELLLSCLRSFADIVEASVASRRYVVGQLNVISFLLQCLEDAEQTAGDKIHFAINSLECLSMEKELADMIASLDGLLLVPKLLLPAVSIMGRETQFFATEMIGYMTSYGHVDKLGLEKLMLWRILSFVSQDDGEDSVDGGLGLALWTLAHLCKSAMKTTVTAWIAKNDDGITAILHSGLTLPHDHAGSGSSVTANALAVLLSVCSTVGGALNLVKRNVCSVVASHLEAVEKDIHLPALRILSVLLTHYPWDDLVVAQKERWPVIFRQLLEWMEVYAREPARCALEPLADAFVCLGYITALPTLANEVRAGISRTGLAEIVGSSIIFFDPKRTRSGEPTSVSQSGEVQVDRERLILHHALKICGNLMAQTAAYSERFFLLSVPQSIGNVLMVDDDDLITASLDCVRLLADWSSNRQLLFASLRCITRLSDLLRHHATAVVAKITPLLSMMCTRIPGLPGLCCVEGISNVCALLEVNWSKRDADTTRITEDCSAILLSIFSSEEHVYAVYDEVDVVGRVFEIVVSNNAPELLLRILVKVSGSSQSHVRYLKLLDPMCRLLSGVLHGNTSQHLILCVLFNLFCRTDDPILMAETLHAGERTLLPQLLPLSRWLGIPNSASIRVVLKILHMYLSSPTYKQLLNDGKNIPALLELVTHTSDEVSIAAAQLVLVAASERDVEIAITVEDGVAIFVRTLQKTTKWHLKCLILSILRNMCHDSEIPVLIMNADGISRLAYYIRERKSVLFASDERLRLSLKILRYISAVPNSASRIVEARGHTRVLELSGFQESSASESERSISVEILVNLARSREVTGDLVESKLHNHLLKLVLSQNSTNLPPSRKLALEGILWLCKLSNVVREEVAATDALIGVLEALLNGQDINVAHIALSILTLVSKVQKGRQSIFARASSTFISRVCEVIVAAMSPIEGHRESLQSASGLGTITLRGLRLLGNTLSDSTSERLQVTWKYDDLVKLCDTLEKVLANHQNIKPQLHALNVMSGSFAGKFYFPITAQMLSDLCNVLLISPSGQHYTQAERVIVGAFQDEDQVRLAIGGSQVLEQLLIVFTQKVDAQERRQLIPVLVQVLEVSMAKSFIVNQRFLSKIVTLLSSAPLSSRLDTTMSADKIKQQWSSEDADEDALTYALCVYLGFVYRFATPSGVQQNICDALRSEINTSAQAVLFVVLLCRHSKYCSKPTNASSSTSVMFTHRELLVWNLLVDSISMPSPSAHTVNLIGNLPLSEWYCLLDDLLVTLEQDHSVCCRIDSGGNVSNAHIAPIVAFTQEDALVSSMAMLSVHSNQKSSYVDGNTPVDLCTWCLKVALMAEGTKTRQLEASVKALLNARAGWGDQTIVQACKTFEPMSQLIQNLLAVFHIDSRDLDETRHILLHLFLLMVSSGSFIEELKAANIREAIENNELIATTDKSLPITILGLLGYNADLNAEFELMLQRYENSSDTKSRSENLASVRNFLQLYTLTDERLHERAIDCFMQQLHLAIDFLKSSPENNHLTDQLRDLFFCFTKAAGTRKFVELFSAHWSLDTLLGVAFSRVRTRDLKAVEDRLIWTMDQVSEFLTMATRLTDSLSPSGLAGVVGESTFINAVSFVDGLDIEDASVAENVLSVMSWAVVNEETFDVFCRHASRFHSFLRYLTTLSDDSCVLFNVMDAFTKRVPRVDMLSDLLTDLLASLYDTADNLSKSVRGKLLVYILAILKRMGEEGLSGSRIYEQAVQLILANVHTPVEAVVRCSWDLLGVLTELDPAIVAIFNFDGVPILLREFCITVPTAPKEPPRLSRNAITTPEDRAFSKATSERSEILYRRMEALKCLSKAARHHDEVLYKISEAPGIGPQLFRALVGEDMDDNAANSAAQEHAAHLIARISSQELFRASLLSQGHITTLIESLESVHSKIVLHALETLFYLCEFTMCLDSLVQNATVPVLGQILASPFAEELAETHSKTELYVTGLLAKMCAKKKIIGRRVVSSNLLPRLRQFLVSPRQQIQFFAAWIVKSVSKDPELVAKLYEQRILETLAQQLREYNPMTTMRKAFGAISNMIASHRPGMPELSYEVLHLVASTVVEAMDSLMVVPNTDRTMVRGLTVLEAIGVISQVEKDLLWETQALQLTTQLLDAMDSRVKTRAFHALSRWVEDNSNTEHIRELMADAPLLSIVRTISEEPDDALLVALSLLHTLLSTNEELRNKLSGMTNEVLLRLVSMIVTSSEMTELPSLHVKALAEALKSLVSMTRGGKVAIATSSVILKSLDPLVDVLRQAPSEGIRINALYLLVNFASMQDLRQRMVTNGTMKAFLMLLRDSRDDRIQQLALLGVALLTGNDFSSVIPDLLSVVDVLVSCLSSKNASIQANAVWVVSNICTEDRLKEAIVSRGGATTLQAILNDTLTVDQATRPTSSSQRIREYAPKAIKKMGFAAMTVTLSPSASTQQ
ncbi:hypothetical protein Poli38472_002758 [Pythium oligandrum]|uniref:Uncharacterized protein n=1 Tax=Pythium oligandrum TaxID=41045 RepID=A0A8K1CI37_PYTOL|nr:hypothetical protein Poli38472_002758 [Pythium oligandrum]|eukprot:TMW63817.1 hypothetical protein Poli38472_002758 [Pythium oligandrum]